MHSARRVSQYPSLSRLVKLRNNNEGSRHSDAWQVLDFVHHQLVKLINRWSLHFRNDVRFAVDGRSFSDKLRIVIHERLNDISRLVGWHRNEHERGDYRTIDHINPSVTAALGERKYDV